MARCLSYTRYIEDKYLRKVAVWQLEPLLDPALYLLYSSPQSPIISYRSFDFLHTSSMLP
jgi:hypothetical protein